MKKKNGNPSEDMKYYQKKKIILWQKRTEIRVGTEFRDMLKYISNNKFKKKTTTLVFFKFCIYLFWDFLVFFFLSKLAIVREDWAEKYIGNIE